jgi:hypothetical protein
MPRGFGSCWRPPDNRPNKPGGNVCEWCEDFQHGTSGPHVLRGASWNFASAGHLLSSYRNGALRDARSNAIGVHCVLEGLESMTIGSLRRVRQSRPGIRRTLIGIGFQSGFYQR